MKKLLLAILVVSSLVSCGKNNSTNTGAVANTLATSPISTINSNPSFQTLANAVLANSFNAQYSNYYTEYRFGNTTNTCVTKDGWFGIDYQSCSTSISNPVTVIHGQVVIATKQAEINAILAKSVVFQAVSGTYFVVRTTDNYTYHIRTDYPIQANPVYSLNNADSKALSLTSIKL